MEARGDAAASGPRLSGWRRGSAPILPWWLGSHDALPHRGGRTKPGGWQGLLDVILLGADCDFGEEGAEAKDGEESKEGEKGETEENKEGNKETEAKKEEDPKK